MNEDVPDYMKGTELFDKEGYPICAEESCSYIVSQPGYLCSEHYKEWKERERARKDYRRRYFENRLYKCELCGLTAVTGEDKKRIHVHHLDGNHDNNDLFNLIALCQKCHGTIEHHGWKEGRKIIHEGVKGDG